MHLASRAMMEGEDEDSRGQGGARGHALGGGVRLEDLPTQRLTALEVGRLRNNAEGDCAICMQVLRVLLVLSSLFRFFSLPLSFSHLLTLSRSPS